MVGYLLILDILKMSNLRKCQTNVCKHLFQSRFCSVPSIKTIPSELKSLYKFPLGRFHPNTVKFIRSILRIKMLIILRSLLNIKYLTQRPLHVVLKIVAIYLKYLTALRKMLPKCSAFYAHGNIRDIRK